MKSDNSGSSGLGLSSVLTVVFIVLKLVGVINWSWIWVLSPLLITFVAAIIIVIIWIFLPDNEWHVKERK